MRPVSLTCQRRHDRFRICCRVRCHVHDCFAVSGRPGTARAADGIDALEGFLAQQDEIEDVFNWSGYVMLYTMEHLAQAHGIAVTDTALESDGSSIYVYGTEHQQLVPLLDPDRFEENELGNALRTFSLDFDEAGIAALDAITVLRDQLSALTHDRALVVSIY